MTSTLAAVSDLRHWKVHGVRRLGSATLDLAYVGLGRLAPFEYALAPWDFAAGRLFVEEAGGTARSPDAAVTAHRQNKSSSPATDSCTGPCWRSLPTIIRHCGLEAAGHGCTPHAARRENRKPALTSRSRRMRKSRAERCCRGWGRGGSVPVGKRRVACSQESGAVRNEFAPRFDLVIALALGSAGDCAASFSNRSASLTFSWNPCDGPSWGLGLIAGSRPARAFVTSSFLASAAYFSLVVVTSWVRS